MFTCQTCYGKKPTHFGSCYVENISSPLFVRLWHVFAQCIFMFYHCCSLAFSYRSCFLSVLVVQDVARFCNRYPNIELSFEVEDNDDITA